MKDDAKVIVLVTAAVVAGCGLGYAVANKVPSKIDKDWWDIVSSVGTFLAAAVALYFGTSGQIVLARQARSHARLQAARLVNEMTIASEMLKPLLARLRLYEGTDEQTADLCSQPGWQIMDCSLLKITAEQVQLLSSVPNDAALHLARAVGCLTYFVAAWKALGHGELLWKQAPAKRKERFRQLHTEGYAADVFIAMAGVELKKIVGADKLDARTAVERYRQEHPPAADLPIQTPASK